MIKHSILSAAILLAACGGNDAPKGTVNLTGARSSVDSVQEVFTALDGRDGAHAADAVMALTAAGQVVVVPEDAASARMAQLPERLPRSKTPHVTGNASCDDNGCVFDNFGDDSEYGSYRINGSIQRAGDLLTFDLTYDITTDGIDFHWELDGAVRANATLVDGDVHSHGDATIESDGRTYEMSWDFDIDYDNIVLDGSGCPVSGSLAATVAYDVAGAGSYRASGSITFGPTCGQARAN